MNKNGPHRELWRGDEGKDKEIEEKESENPVKKLSSKEVDDMKKMIE